MRCHDDVAERGRREFEARDREAKAQVLEYARGWGRTLRAYGGKPDQIRRRLSVQCRSVQPDDGELAHTNQDCPVLIYLRLARLIVEDAERRCLPG